MAAGVEGGSWSAIENEWTLNRYHKIMEVWHRDGPPPFISLASSIGYKGKNPDGKNKSTDGEKLGTMEDLVRELGGSSSAGKVTF